MKNGGKPSPPDNYQTYQSNGHDVPSADSIGDCDSQQGSSDSGRCSADRTVDQHIPTTKTVCFDQKRPDKPSVNFAVGVFDQMTNSLSGRLSVEAEEELVPDKVLSTRDNINVDEDISNSLLKDMRVRCQEDPDSDADSLRYGRNWCVIELTVAGPEPLEAA
jgi:hypothetical protein